MKVKLIYSIEYVKEVEMTPEEYCNLHADHSYGGFFPDMSFAQATDIDCEAVRELEDFFRSRKQA